MFIFHVWMLNIIITVVSSARGYVHISCLNAVHHHHHSGIFSSNMVMFIFHVWMLYIIIITVVSSALTRLCSYFMSECCTSSSSQWYLQLVVMFIFHVWMLYIIITVVSSARGYVHISCLNPVHHHHSGIFSSRLCSYFMSECCISSSSSQWYLQLCPSVETHLSLKQSFRNIGLCVTFNCSLRTPLTVNRDYLDWLWFHGSELW